MLIDFFFDFETRSRADLKKVGAIKYALDPSTEATLLTWCFGKDGAVKAWRLGQPIPNEIIHVAQNPHKFNHIAHNVLFDYVIWTIPFARLIPGLVRPKIQNITDNMSHSQYWRVGSGLDGVAAMLRLPYSKDKEGRRLMLKQAKPNGKTGEFPELTPEEWHKFERYGIIDTELLRDSYYRMPVLPRTERWAWEWTFRRNLTGIKVDVDLLNAMVKILEVEVPKLSKEFEHRVGYQFKPNQRAKLLEWLKYYYPRLPDLQKGTVRDLLDSPYHPNENARRVVEIKSIVGSTSLAKIPTAVDRLVYGRIYELLNHLKAQTKRWAGMGIQIHNFPRPEKIKEIPSMDVKNLAAELLRVYPTHEDPIALVKNLLRRIWVPDEGKRFYCGDFSKIEPTVLFWLVGLGPIPPKWYEEMAAEIFGVRIDQIDEESEERQLGKNTNLGSGYGMGPDKFVVQVKQQSGQIVTPEMARRCISAYRRKYWQVPEFWRHLEWGFKKAISGETVSLCSGKVYVMPIGQGRSGVKIRLPSGSFLYYHGARIGDKGKLSYEAALGSTVVRENIYGGLLCENVVSAIARDILLSSMGKLEAAEFDVLNTIHDEIWAQAEAGRDKEFEEVMCRLPTWCSDLKVSVDSKNGKRYLK